MGNGDAGIAGLLSVRGDGHLAIASKELKDPELHTRYHLHCHMQ